MSRTSTPTGAPRLPRKIMMHSHDSFGLGHLRRTLTLAGTLAAELPDTSVLITSGSPCATHFPIPQGVDIVKLPSVTKDGNGNYVARSLPEGIGGVLAIRAAILGQVFETFAPDLLIVDHQPLGLAGELYEILREARGKGVRTVLGLRDIIDEPAVVAEHWGVPRVREALRGFYDRVCVYGTPEVFDTRKEYPIPPELREVVEFTGYVVRPFERPEHRPAPPRPQVLVTMGGGEDGEAMVQSYLESVKGGVPWDSTIVLGALMHPDRARHIKRAARRLGHVRVRSFYSDLPRLLCESDAVVSMAGYNTIAEILYARVPAVLLPRVFPRREQLMRTRRLRELGLARMLLDPNPLLLREAVEKALTDRPDWSNLPSFEGRHRMCEVAAEMLSGSESWKEACAP